MATLSRVTSETKFIIKWLLILFIIFIIVKIGLGIKEKLYPTPPPPPTVSFGKIDSIKFPEIPTDKQLTYTLDTLSGTLPVFPDRLRVYKIIQNRIDFLTVEKIQNKVSVLGFGNRRSLISENTYQWIATKDKLSKISFNIKTYNFTYSSSFITDPAIQSAVNLPTESDSINIAKSFLENLSLDLSDIDFAKTKTTFQSIKNYTIIPVVSISKSQIIRVDFFQKNIDKIPIFYPTAKFSTINLLVSGGNTPGVVEAFYSHKEIANESATYPIKSASLAFSELKQGKAYIATSADNNKDIVIKNVYLGYYLGSDEQKYLMPIIIFEGENDFLAYVSAVKDEWVNK